MAKMKILDWAGYSLVTIGALNWGLTGAGNFMNANWNVVNLLLGSMSWLENSVYVLVGLAGVYSLWTAIKLATK